MDAVALAVGGIEDHVHLLVSLRSKHRLGYFLRDLKADSSAFVHKEFTRLFEWQKGYGGFSVCPHEIAAVRKYIENQEAHHRRETFMSEYVRLLEENEIEYDDQCLW